MYSPFRFYCVGLKHRDVTFVLTKMYLKYNRGPSWTTITTIFSGLNTGKEKDRNQVDFY
jgi:hypothetical protein